MGGWELGVLHALQALHAPWLDACMCALSYIGGGARVWLVVGVALFACRKTRRAGLAVLIAALMSEAVFPVIKALVARPRPFEVDPSVTLLVAPPADASFPSGHAMVAFAAASALAVCVGARRWALWLPAMLLAAGIGFSRLYLFVHWPTDVAAGALLGVAAGCLVGTLAKRGRRGVAGGQGRRAGGAG